MFDLTVFWTAFDLRSQYDGQGSNSSKCRASVLTSRPDL